MQPKTKSEKKKYGEVWDSLSEDAKRQALMNGRLMGEIEWQEAMT